MDSQQIEGQLFSDLGDDLFAYFIPGKGEWQNTFLAL